MSACGCQPDPWGCIAYCRVGAELDFERQKLANRYMRAVRQGADWRPIRDAWASADRAVREHLVGPR